MQEFDSIKVSTYEADKLAPLLTERASQGWAVVSIVTAGSDVVAYLGRLRDDELQPGVAAEPTATAVAADSPAVTSEPAGWGSAPESSNEPAAAATDVAAASTEQSATVADAGTQAVPPGWFNDPAGRFDLRYWDGTQWTEHVTRGGQQYTDPPVA